jgi:hypothetical protein
VPLHVGAPEKTPYNTKSLAVCDRQRVRNAALSPSETDQTRCRRMGHKRRLDGRPVTSGLPSTPDMSHMQRNKQTTSLDNLVGACEQRRRDREAERLGGLEIDHQFDFFRLLGDGEIGRFGALQNPAGVCADLAIALG